MTFVALPAVTLHMREQGVGGPVLVLLHELGSLHSFHAVSVQAPCAVANAIVALQSQRSTAG